MKQPALHHQRIFQVNLLLQGTRDGVFDLVSLERPEWSLLRF